MTKLTFGCSFYSKDCFNKLFLILLHSKFCVNALLKLIIFEDI